MLLIILLKDHGGVYGMVPIEVWDEISYPETTARNKYIRMSQSLGYVMIELHNLSQNIQLDLGQV